MKETRYLFLVSYRKGDDSCKYCTQRSSASKRCSSNVTHVSKVTENGLFKEQKTVVRKSRNVLVSAIKSLFSKKKSPYLMVAFSECNSLDYFVIRIPKASLQDSLYQQIPQWKLLVPQFFVYTFKSLPQGQQKFMLLIISKIMSLMLNKQILF